MVKTGVRGHLTSGKSLFVTDRAECYRLTRSEEGQVCHAVPALQSNHEEADTRLVLHAAHAGNGGHSHVVIKSLDTDVALLAVAHSSQTNGTVLFLTGNKHRRRYVNLSQTGRKLGPQVCRVLPGMHALTGCDSTSAFVGKGKVQALQLVTSCEQIQQHLQLLGPEFDPPNFERLATACQSVVCALYGYASADISAVRYAMFCARAADSSQLPPTQDGLCLHIRCANYQATVWRCALEAKSDVPSPHNHGWVVEDGCIRVVWMELPPAPRDVLKLISCNCRTGCKS